MIEPHSSLSCKAKGHIMEKPDNKYWPLFWTICIAAWIIEAAISLNWTGSAGYIFVPSLIGFFFVRSSRTLSGVRASYGAFLVILIAMIGTEINRARLDIVDEIVIGCMTRNTAVTVLPTEEMKNIFCTCFSKDLSWIVMRELGVSFLLFREPRVINDDPTMQARATSVWNQCVPLIEN